MPNYKAHFDVTYNDASCESVGTTGGRATEYGTKTFSANDDGDARKKAWSDFDSAAAWIGLVPTEAKWVGLKVTGLERVLEVGAPTVDVKTPEKQLSSERLR